MNGHFASHGLMLGAILPGVALAASAALAAQPRHDDTVAGAAEEYVRYSGTATALHGSGFLYGERHVLYFHDGSLVERTVLYTCADGSAFARKTVRYVDPLAPDFLLEDTATGMREGIRSESGGRVVFFRLHGEDTEHNGPLPHVAGLVADAGFDAFVRANWGRLLANETLQMPFVVPSRLREFSFQVQRLRSENVAGTPSEVFRLRLSGFWGWFLHGIDVYYSADGHVLVRYDGLSDLRDMAGDPLKVEISFPVAARAMASEQDLRAASQAGLRRCNE